MNYAKIDKTERGICASCEHLCHCQPDYTGRETIATYNSCNFNYRTNTYYEKSMTTPGLLTKKFMHGYEFTYFPLNYGKRTLVLHMDSRHDQTVNREKVQTKSRVVSTHTENRKIHTTATYYKKGSDTKRYMDVVIVEPVEVEDLEWYQEGTGEFIAGKHIAVWHVPNDIDRCECNKCDCPRSRYVTEQYRINNYKRSQVVKKDEECCTIL